MDITPNRVGIVGWNKLNWRKTADGYAPHKYLKYLSFGLRIQFAK
jgi:hypothetical protein